METSVECVDDTREEVWGYGDPGSEGDGPEGAHHLARAAFQINGILGDGDGGWGMAEMVAMVLVDAGT